MLETLALIKDYLSQELDDIVVEIGYSSDILTSPVSSPAVYLTIKDTDTEESGGRFNFSAYVYTNTNDGGKECIRTAQSVAAALVSCTDVSVAGLNIGEVTYNNSTDAFVIELTAGAPFTDDEGEVTSIAGYLVIASDFESGECDDITMYASSVVVKTDCSHYPIMTICTGVPEACVNAQTEYTITLSGVSAENAQRLRTNGSFTLKVKSGSSEEEYSDCGCDSVTYEYGGTDKVTVISYTAF